MLFLVRWFPFFYFLNLLRGLVCVNLLSNLQLVSRIREITRLFLIYHYFTANISFFNYYVQNVTVRDPPGHVHRVELKFDTVSSPPPKKLICGRDSEKDVSMVTISLDVSVLRSVVIFPISSLNLNLLIHITFIQDLFCNPLLWSALGSCIGRTLNK